MKHCFYLIVLVLVSACASQPRPSMNSEAVVIAHRSASGYLPEHTLVAMAMAHGWDVDYVEPDVVLTRDSVPVVMHDIHLDTTTDVAQVFPRRARKDGRFYVVDFTISEIKKLRVHERRNLKTSKAVFEKRFPVEANFFSVPTLDEYLKTLDGLNKSRATNVGVYIELKADAFHRAEKKDIQETTLKVLRENDYLSASKKLILQSFEPETLMSLRNKLGPQVVLVQLIAENSWAETPTDYDALQTPEGLRKVRVYANGIGPYLGQIAKAGEKGVVSSGLIEEAHAVGLFVHPYTHRSDALPKGFASDKAFFDFLFGTLKADGVFTDFGDRTMKYLGR